MRSELGPNLEAYANIETDTKKVNGALLEIISEGELAKQGKNEVAKKLELTTLEKAKLAIERLLEAKNKLEK